VKDIGCESRVRMAERVKAFSLKQNAKEINEKPPLVAFLSHNCPGCLTALFSLTVTKDFNDSEYR
jgi:hypothetical protein